MIRTGRGERSPRPVASPRRNELRVAADNQAGERRARHEGETVPTTAAVTSIARASRAELSGMLDAAGVELRSLAGAVHAGETSFATGVHVPDGDLRAAVLAARALRVSADRAGARYRPIVLALDASFAPELRTVTGSSPEAMVRALSNADEGARLVALGPRISNGLRSGADLLRSAPRDAVTGAAPHVSDDIVRAVAWTTHEGLHTIAPAGTSANAPTEATVELAARAITPELIEREFGVPITAAQVERAGGEAYSHDVARARTIMHLAGDGSDVSTSRVDELVELSRRHPDEIADRLRWFRPAAEATFTHRKQVLVGT
jgi:hypothetical protein